jgi:hypothetical protein
MNEIWKNIPAYEGMYQVSNLGRVKTVAREVKNTAKSFRKLEEKIHTPCDNGNGYKYVTLSMSRVRSNYYIHRIVAEVFLCNCFELLEVNHIDGNKANNRVDNLEWCTRSENAKHAHKSGLNHVLKGEANPGAKLTEEIVRKVRELYDTGQYTQKKLAEDFGIGKGYIFHIVHRNKWKHVL